MPPTKRSRTEANGGAAVNVLLQLINANPQDLVKAALDTNAATFTKLCEFSANLTESIEQSKRLNQGKDRASKDALEQMEWGRLKAEKRGCVDSHKCFVCKKTADILEPCSCFKESGTGGDGVVVCEDCQENENYTFCPECNTMLSKSCCDVSNKCKGCEEVTCLSCAEKKDFGGRSCYDCQNFFCPGCIKDNLCEEKCCLCSTSAMICENCSGLPECEGECGRPICEDCLEFRQCDHGDARVCGRCSYKCEECNAS